MSLKDWRAVFHGLNHEEEYFPMVARTDVQAFFALPPNPIRPKASGVNLPQTFTSPARPTEHEDYVLDVQNRGFEDLYDDSEDEDESKMDYDAPLEDSSRRTSISDSESDITRLGGTVGAVFESPASSPKTRSPEDGLSQPVRNVCLLQHFYMQ